MSCFSYLEGNLHAGLELILVVLYYLSVVLRKWSLNLEEWRVWEKQIGFSTWKLTLNQSDYLIWRSFQVGFSCFSFTLAVFVDYIITQRHLDYTIREWTIPIVLLFFFFF